MRRTTFGMASVLFLGLALIGCRGDPLAGLDAPEQLTLFSIDGRDEYRRLKDVPVTPTETFQGYPVLGKVEVADAEERKRLMAALKDAHARRPKMGAKCFWPRHGVRVVERGRTVEYVICFECSRFEEFVDGEKRRHELLNPDAQPTFDQPLTAAGVQIAPK